MWNVSIPSQEAIGIGAEFSLDGRYQMMNGRPGFHPQHRGNLDAAARANAPQIVTFQIDDHDVFGAFLGVGCKFRGQGPIARSVQGSWPSSLDRLGADHVALQQ